MLQDAGVVECESVDERLNAMEDAFRSEIDHLTKEMRPKSNVLKLRSKMSWVIALQAKTLCLPLRTLPTNG